MAAGEVIELNVELEQEFYGALQGTVLQPGGAPATGAKVYLGSSNGYFGEPTRIVGAEGRFKVEREAEGDYALIVTHPECAPLIVDGVRIERDKTTPQPVQLTPGGALSGKVAGENQTPVTAAAHIVLRRPDDGNAWSNVNSAGQRPGLQFTEVRKDGTYQLPHVAPGNYAVELWMEGQVGAAKRDLEITEGKATTLDFDVLPANGVVRGRVTLADGQPATVAQVALLPAAGGQMRIGPQHLTKLKNGSYSVEGVTPGDYYVMCMLGDERRMPLNMVMARHETKITVTNEAPVEGIDFAFDEGAVVTGIVVDAGTQQPVPNAQVLSAPFEAVMVLRTGRGNPVDWPLRMLVTSADTGGKFTVTGVPPGDYTFSAMGREHLPGTSAAFTVELGKATAEVKIELQKGDVEAWMKKQRKGR